MQNEFVTFQTFDDLVLLENLVALLNDNDIPFLTQENTTTVTPALSNPAFAREYSVKISPENFVRVNKLLRDAEKLSVEEVAGDHYLFSFNDYELLEVLSKADEWSAFDYALAKKILLQRGVAVDERREEELRLQRIKELSNKEKPQATLVRIGYIMALLGGVVGFFIGYMLATNKKTLPDGTRMYTYLNNDRWHGRNIMFIGALVIIGVVIYKFYAATANS